MFLDNIKFDDKETIKEFISEFVQKGYGGQDAELLAVRKYGVNLEKYLNNIKEEIGLTSTISKSIDVDILLDANSIIEKSRTGVYSDNAQNRQLKRVGQKYGIKGQEEQSTGKQASRSDSKEKKKYNDKELAEHAKNASQADLERQIKESDDPKIRKQAHEELDRRSKEESVQEKEKFTESEQKEKTVKEDSLKTTDFTNKRIKADEVETGKPFKMTFLKNTEKAPTKTNQDFGQKIEPHGNYMTNTDGRFIPEGWSSGEIEFKSPLVIEHKDTSSNGWKGDLAKRFGKKGAELSKELISRGYDAIVTTDAKYNELSEIVSLKDFKG